MELLRHGLVGASQVPKCLVGLGVALAPQDALDGLTWDVDQAKNGICLQDSDPFKAEDNHLILTPLISPLSIDSNL